MAEIAYEPEFEGWFKVSRRFVNSSRWMTGSLEAIKLMVYMLERASHPFNPHPGDVLEATPVLVKNACMTPEQVEKALAELAGPDPLSQGRAMGGAFIEELTRGGEHVGWRVINFAAHNPKEMASARVKKERRVESARKASTTRWEKERAANASAKCEIPGCDRDVWATQADGRLVCTAHSFAEEVA